MPGKYWAFTVPHDEKRPLDERGFTEIKPNSVYANHPTCNFRKEDIPVDGKDPLQAYPPDLPKDKNPGAQTDGKVTH